MRHWPSAVSRGRGRGDLPAGWRLHPTRDSCELLLQHYHGTEATLEQYDKEDARIEENQLHDFSLIHSGRDCGPSRDKNQWSATRDFRRAPIAKCIPIPVIS